MTHLRIEQDDGSTQYVSNSVITKLYELAISGDLDQNSNLIGNLHVSGTYRKYKDYLEQQFNSTNNKGPLYITADNYYKSFVDPNAARFFANCPAGDGSGITEAQWSMLSNDWQSDAGIYGYLGNPSYFGQNFDNVQNAVQYSTLQQILHFPEIVDLNTHHGEFDGYYNPIFKAMNNLVEIYCPKSAASINVRNDGWSYPNLEIIDTSTSTNYTGTDAPLPKGDCPKLKKIICAPSIYTFPHAGLIQGHPTSCDIFMYCTNLDLSLLSGASTWCLDSNNVYTIWVQDSQYNTWLNNPQISSRVSNGTILLKRFSEYTGNDLVQKWLEQPQNT